MNFHTICLELSDLQDFLIRPDVLFANCVIASSVPTKLIKREDNNKLIAYEVADFHNNTPLYIYNNKRTSTILLHFRNALYKLKPNCATNSNVITKYLPIVSPIRLSKQNSTLFEIRLSEM